MITVEFKNNINKDNLINGLYYISYIYNYEKYEIIILYEEIDRDNKHIKLLFYKSDINRCWMFITDTQRCSIDKFFELYNIREIRKIDDINFVVGDTL